MTRRAAGPYEGGTNLHCKQMDALLEKRPPVIKWEKNKRGVMVAVEIHDPHGETSTAAQCERMNAAADRADKAAQAIELEEARLRVVETLQTDEAAERVRTHQANNAQLMAAARTEI